MHPEYAIGVQVDVELAAVGPQFGGTAEGCEGVLRALAGRAAVGDDFGAGHGTSLTSVRPRRLTFRGCL